MSKSASLSRCAFYAASRGRFLLLDMMVQLTPVIERIISMQMKKNIWKTMGIFIAAVTGGVGLLVLAFMIPTNEKNKEISLTIMEEEGWYPAIPVVNRSLDTHFHSYLPGVLDNSTDSIMVGTAVNVSEKNVLRAAMDMNGYSRYWHGYISVLRPLLAVFDYWEIRVINAMGQFLLEVLILLFIFQKMGMKYFLLELTSYCFLMPLAIPFSLQCSWVFYVTKGFLLYLVSRKQEQLPDGIKLYWIYMIVGMLTSYFDLLTYPLYTWGIPTVWWILLQAKPHKQSVYVKKVIYTGIWWVSGYAGMWAMKWCLGSVVLGRNVFEDALGSVRSRSNVDNGLALFERLESLYINWRHYSYKIYIILLVMWLLFLFGRSMRNGMLHHEKNKSLLLVATSAGVWYFVVSQHTKIHHFFTHRIWGISILAICSLLLLSTEEVKMQKKVDMVKTLLVWGGCGLLAFGLSFLPKEDVFVTNGWAEFVEIPVKEGQVCEMSFTPSFPMIDSFTLCARTDSRQGDWKIVIADGEKELYEEYIPLEKYQDKTFADIPVLWKLKKEKTYSMRISLVGADRDAYLLVTADHNMPLSEYDEVKMGGKPENGQILAILNYRYRVLSKIRLCTIWTGWMGILFAIVTAFFAKNKREIEKNGLLSHEIEG